MTTDQLHERDVFPRPSHHDIQSTWEKLFSDPLVSVARLKSRSLDKAGLGPAGPDGGVILRSVYWRFYHNLLPSPTSLDLFPQALDASRESYNVLRRRYLIAPDGRWASDCSGFDESLTPASPTRCASPRIASAVHGSPLQPSDGWDPLSLSTSSPWKTWFAHTELRATIRQDVERTFPDMSYFQLERVQRCMATALFIFAVLNPDVGYRQGMHELFACCFMAVDRDSLKVVNKAEGQQREAMFKTLDRRYVEHDAFELFMAIMKNAKAFYEWRAEEGPIRSRTATVPQAPIIVKCNNLHTSLLRRIDPQLYERLETEGVEAQIWAIRWIRLIFTRELPFSVAMRLWDGIFAEDPGLQLLDYICIAMLLLVRNELIDADYPSLLTNLLHYPAPSSTYPFEPFLILAQALFLRSDSSPAAGVEIVIQNQDLLDVKAAPKNQEMDLNDPRSHHSRFAGGRGNGRTISGTVKERLQKGGVGGLAQGLFERAQAAGLDKAFISTVNDFRKNLPDSTTAYSYLPNLPFSPSHSPGPRASSLFSAIPNSASALPSRSFLSPHSPSVSNSTPPPRPALQSRSSIDSQTSQISVKTIKDAEREMAELRLAMLGMGKAMSEWLEVLNNPEQHMEKSERENAWKGLERVKETLIDAAGKEVDDIVKEWGWHEGLEASSSRSSTPAPSVMVPPLEAPITEPEPSHAAGVAASGPSPMDYEEVTPTPLSVAVMPTTPRFLSASRHSLSPISQGSSLATSRGEKRLSAQTVRGDGPISGLPRVPHTVPINSESTRYRSEEARRPASAGLGIISVGEKEQSKDQLPANVDPLAGLGTEVRESRRHAGAVVDPLLGIDVQ
ncbi:TBC1 domain family member 5 [Cryptococcus neoformans C23]|uniref:TBC1 domain family member 5 n=1 Tax=Cryptococcus neoformans (strain H99 / ATCC 208821 / CBS 10515 / FGSC 9487) TaxID=235443 RepID=J9VUE4_CRYN9|nr:TBC1 domain family member 5 [Cryptococcus neoformans var. grubii H99]AUB28173.1 TBC1 domain family member 5 [Cryptococcus neoformans var. grubii]OWZ33890.1 TBC1 domain family member 5 [Cryptococcus neoformans var. grubii AD2-60a]OWZ46018.1 TBC1 domain family member 5 [Cryptococcus neoformans var. grubii C23]OWZ56221.1 TBC1 domain family member 5 [Cryptococcus neoformans var. grubii 125.91]OXG36993.1 TBC1 domain family member 5 [Cryptococcus neoformans var. grubii Bt15]OXG44131.1 TBC1 domai|eukprot:XP_012052819.1 TBC1 domain family member 5 [Cryptococcus neoformans var. grubii H99]